MEQNEYSSSTELAKNQDLISPQIQTVEVPKKEKKDKKKKKKDEAKSTSTMFRNLMANHLQINGLADRKAGLLLHVNAIIISIMTSFMVHEFATNPKLLLPTCLLISVCLLTITFALLSTRPHVKPPTKVLPTDDSQKIDLLFFGDYTRLSVEEYKTAMKAMMITESHLQDKMIENIYAQGKVIVKKYRLLKTAYTIFMIGFPIAVVTFLIALRS